MCLINARTGFKLKTKLRLIEPMHYAKFQHCSLNTLKVIFKKLGFFLFETDYSGINYGNRVTHNNNV